MQIVKGFGLKLEISDVVINLSIFLRLIFLKNRFGSSNILLFTRVSEIKI